jgi:hypothetical protein
MAGTWMVRRARASRIPHALVLPCLGFSILYAPLGLIAFAGLRLSLAARTRRLAA